MNEPEARALVETMAKEYPGAYRLAQVVSIAVRIELELLRSARLRLLPEIDAGAEADLWFSSLVQSQSPLAMTFLPEVVEVLREKLVEDQALLEGAGKLLEEFHQNAPPALRLEEEVTWLALSGAANSDLIRKRLESVSAAIMQDNRPGLVRWASRALPSLPARARDSDAAHILALVATVPETLNLPTSSGHTTVNERLTQIITQSLPKVEVGIRLFRKDANGAGELKESVAASTSNEQAMVVELSYPPQPDSDEDEVIEVPQTNPVLIEVSWQGEATERNSERVSLQAGQSQLLEVRSGELSIRTALGDLHNLQPRMDYDFFLHHSPVDRNWAIALIERLQREEYEGRPLKVYIPVVSGDPGQLLYETFERPFRVSRKVGLVLSPESAEQDWNDIQEFSTRRIHPARISDWIIPIYHRPCEVPETLKSVPAIDLGENSDFEQGFNQLLSAITTQRELVPELETESEPVIEQADVSTTPPAQETKPEPVMEEADASATLTAEESKPKPVKRKIGVRAKAAETPLKLYVSYVHEDKQYLDKFLPHLKRMERERMITVWHDASLIGGSKWDVEIEKQLESASIILLFVSAHYLASDFANAQMNRALERHKNKQAVVIPVLVRPASWQRTPLSELEILPKGARPITMWPNRDAAYVDITNGIRKVIELEQFFRDTEDLLRTDKQPATFRWQVRTATDEDIGKIKPDVVGTTIQALAKQSRPSDMPLKTVRAPKYQSRRVSPVETTKWLVEATIVAYKRQTSGGYRLTLKGDDETTMIAVAQDPDLSQSWPFAKAMASVVQTLTKRFEFGPTFVSTQVAARVVGLGFFNRWHAQSAGAPNAVELQPLLELEWLSESSARPSSGTGPLTQKAVNIEVQIRRLSESDSGIDGKKLVQDFARINPGLKLTMVSLSRSIRGRSRLVGRVEGLSDPGANFTITARDALARTIEQMFPSGITPHKGLSFTVQELKEERTKKGSIPKSKVLRKGKRLIPKKASAKKSMKKR